MLYSATAGEGLEPRVHRCSSYQPPHSYPFTNHFLCLLDMPGAGDAKINDIFIAPPLHPSHQISDSLGRETMRVSDNRAGLTEWKAGPAALRGDPTSIRAAAAELYTNSSSRDDMQGTGEPLKVTDAWDQMCLRRTNPAAMLRAHWGREQGIMERKAIKGTRPLDSKSEQRLVTFGDGLQVHLTYDTNCRVWRSPNPPLGSETQ